MTTPTGRLAQLRAAVQALDREDVQAISLPLPDDARLAARAVAVRAARDAGRGADLDAARSQMRNEALVRYRRAMLQPTWIGLNWAVSTGSTSDQAAVAAALDEAAVLAVTEDLLGEDDRETLAWAPSILIGSAAHTADRGSLARALGGTPRSRPWVLLLAVYVAVVLGIDLVLGFGFSAIAVLLGGLLLIVWLAQRDTRRKAP